MKQRQHSSAIRERTIVHSPCCCFLLFVLRKNNFFCCWPAKRTRKMLPPTRSQIDHRGTVVAPWIDNVRSQVIHDGAPIAFRRQYKRVRFHRYQQGRQGHQPGSSIGVPCGPASAVALGGTKGIDLEQGDVGIDIPSLGFGSHEFLVCLWIFCS